MSAILEGILTGIWAIVFTIASINKIVDEQGYERLTALAEWIDQTCANLVTLIKRPRELY